MKSQIKPIFYKTLKKEIAIHLYQRTNLPVNTENLEAVFQKAIYEIAFVHNLKISMYDLDGKLLKTSVLFALENEGNNVESMLIILLHFTSVVFVNALF